MLHKQIFDNMSSKFGHFRILPLLCKSNSKCAFFRQIVSVVVHCNDIHDFIIKAGRQLFLATGFDEMMLINEAINIFGRLHIEIVVSRIISFSLQKRVSMVFLRCIGDESSSKICVCHQT